MDNISTKFVVTNCQKKKSATLLLNKNVNIEENIIAITEPWLGSNKKCSFQSPWKTTVKEDNSRVALITPPWAEAFMISDLSDRDSVFCKLNIGSEKILVGVIYTENGIIDINDYQIRFNRLQTICQKMIVFADTNAHSKLWGYSKSDKKGKMWEELLGLTNLEVFTNSYAVTFKNSRDFSSCIDVAVGTPNIKHEFSDRITNIFPTASDHLVWGLEWGVDRQIENDTFWKLKTADWDKVNQMLANKIDKVQVPDIADKASINQAVDCLTVCIWETMAETIDKQKKKPKHRWWNRELTEIQNSIEREQDLEARKELTRSLELKCLESQGKSWKEFATNCNSVSGAYLKKKLLCIDKKRLGLQSIAKDDGTTTQSGEETAQYLLNKWFKMNRQMINNNLKELEDEIEKQVPSKTIEDFSPITLCDVEGAVASMKPYSAPGDDGIPIIVIQKTITVIGPKLVSIFNWCMSLGFTPKKWKVGKTVLIPKPGIQVMNHKAYRPITLLSGLVKIFEKIILKRLQQCSEVDNWISNKQYAFQAGRSVDQALLQYATKISSGLKSKTPTVALHLDIEGAFNSVWRPVLISRLITLGCPKYLVNWCHDYLMDREQIYTTTSYTVRTEVGKSTPQGGSLSPFFWNIVIDPLIGLLEGVATEICAFADDLVVIVSDKSWDTVNRKLNLILDRVNKWSCNNALVFNADKSAYIQYSWQKSIPSLNLKLGDSQVKRVTKIKYLGVMFTEKLQWRAHTTYVANKAMKNLLMLQGIVNRNWGLQGKYMRILYLGAIEPIITHGCIIWGQALNTKVLLKPIKRVQRIAALMITRCNNKTHYLDLLMLAGIPPVQLRVKELSLRRWVSVCADADEPCRDALLQLPAHKQNASHMSALQQLELWGEQAGVKRSDIEKEHSARRTRLKHNTPVGLITTNQEEVVKMEQDNTVLKYYTDGSKSDEGVGAAYTKWENNTIVDSWASPLHYSLSNYKAELIAVKNALENSKHELSDRICIISDSQAVLQALKTPSRNRMVEETRQLLKRINREKTVIIGWTKAHVGNAGNESADKLAKNIAKFRPMILKDKMDRSDTTKLIKDQVLDEWQYLWLGRNTRWSYRWNENVVKQMRLKNFDNYENELLSNFISGSIALNGKLHLWGLSNTPYCQADYGATETPEHFLFRCSDNAELRDRMRKICLDETGQRQLTCKSIWKSDASLKALAEALSERMQTTG